MIMGEFSIWHWLVVLLVVLLLFGGGKVSNLMGEFAKGIKAFKKNMADEPTPALDKPTDPAPAPTITPASLDAIREPTAARNTDRETMPAH
jgi:sec-independent protein translocase protein TatA